MSDDTDQPNAATEPQPTSPPTETPKNVRLRLPPRGPVSIDGKTIGEVRDLVEAYYRPHYFEAHNVPGADTPAIAAALPNSLTFKSMRPYIDEVRGRPERREGKAAMTRLDSFIDHANRFKDPHSALFAKADLVSPALTAVLDYHERDGGDPRFGRHRTVYDCPVSDEWEAWLEKNGKPMSQGDFAEFLEDRIVDISPPPTGADDDVAVQEIAKILGGRYADQATMMDLSRGFKITADERVEETINLSSGETQIAYSQEHRDGEGKPLRVPNLFLIAIPVFKLGQPYRMVVRLRYRKSGGGISWLYQLYQHERTFESAFDDVCEEAREETGLPLYYGAPEPSAARPT